MATPLSDKKVVGDGVPEGEAELVATAPALVLAVDELYTQTEDELVLDDAAAGLAGVEELAELVLDDAAAGLAGVEDEAVEV